MNRSQHYGKSDRPTGGASRRNCRPAQGVPGHSVYRQAQGYRGTGSLVLNHDHGDTPHDPFLNHLRSNPSTIWWRYNATPPRWPSTRPPGCRGITPQPWRRVTAPGRSPPRIEAATTGPGCRWPASGSVLKTPAIPAGAAGQRAGMSVAGALPPPRLPLPSVLARLAVGVRARPGLHPVRGAHTVPDLPLEFTQAYRKDTVNSQAFDRVRGD